MAIERTPGTRYAPTLDAIERATERVSFDKAGYDDPYEYDSPARSAPSTPARDLDVDALVHLVTQTQEIRDRLAPQKKTVPVWARGELPKTVAWVAAVPTLVTGCANLAAHQWGTTGPMITGGVVGAIATVLAVSGMNHHWTSQGTALMLGLSVGSIAWTTSAGSGGWMEVVSWLTAAVGTLGFKLVWNRKHAADKAAVELIQARTRTETLKGDAVQSASALKDTYQLLKIQEAQQAATAPATPVFEGATSEERALRRAVWEVLGHELYSCEVVPTLTGWVATVGLPVALPRSTTKGKWDGVSTALRCNGRFIVSDGKLSNELVVKFLDATKSRSKPLPWSQYRTSADPRFHATLGINTEDGSAVEIQFDERLLICGASGTGKSWSARPLLAHAHLFGHLVVIDGKGEEGNIWEDVARVANESEDIEALIDALHDEMNRRKADMKSRKISVWDGEQLTVYVDEGQVILALVSGDKARMQRLRELASLGRSRGIVLWWATQKPTMSGSAPGIDSQMAGNLLQRFSLRVATEQEARTALDDCAHYAPHLIPQERELRGHGYLKGFGPSLVQTYTLDDDAVRALPVKVWEGELEREAQRISDTPLPDLYARYMIENPGASQRAAADALGVPRTTLARALAKSE
jgi:hypothetical protein